MCDRGVGSVLFFFFQAEDGIRDYKVTGVQTCALPILGRSTCHLKTFLGEIAGLSRRTGESAVFRPVSICINACLKWASYEMLLPDPRSGFNPRPFAESSDLPNYRHVIFQAVYPDRVSSGSVNAELSSALFQSLAILTSCNRCSWSSTLRDLPESISALILANIGADSPKGT